MTTVIDASVVVKLFVHEPDAEAAEEAVMRAPVLAPDLLLLEVASALRKKAKSGDLPSDAVQPALASIQHHVALVPDADLALRAADLAVTWDHPVYDCVYLALAEREDAPPPHGGSRPPPTRLGVRLGVEVRGLE
ncbi:MAG: type II toxin-antitoxin system VapC family toxin [Nitriliruptor sp.]|uniref:type II toxin-antitoxin system VapC family toxin n=1 Tax=Nitriliruptor sp. TaxID=2448056 RepID=UPI0034A09CCB